MKASNNAGNIRTMVLARDAKYNHKSILVHGVHTFGPHGRIIFDNTLGGCARDILHTTAYPTPMHTSISFDIDLRDEYAAGHIVTYVPVELREEWQRAIYEAHTAAQKVRNNKRTSEITDGIKDSHNGMLLRSYFPLLKTRDAYIKEIEHARGSMRAHAKRILNLEPTPPILDLLIWAGDSSYTLLMHACVKYGRMPIFDRIDEFIRRQPTLTEEKIVYKGIQKNQFRIVNGRVVMSRKLAHMPVSTSTDVRAAGRFAMEDGLILKIVLPVGEHVLHIRDRLRPYAKIVDANITDENEVLIASGASLVVRGGVDVDLMWYKGHVRCTLRRFPKPQTARAIELLRTRLVGVRRRQVALVKGDQQRLGLERIDVP